MHTPPLGINHRAASATNPPWQPLFLACERGEAVGRFDGPDDGPLREPGWLCSPAGRAAATGSQKGGDPQRACCLTDICSRSPLRVSWGLCGSRGSVPTGLRPFLVGRAQAIHQVLQRREIVMQELTLASRVWRASGGTASHPGTALTYRVSELRRP